MPRPPYEQLRGPFEPPVQVMAALGGCALGAQAAENLHLSKNLGGLAAGIGMFTVLALTEVANRMNIRKQQQELDS